MSPETGRIRKAVSDGVTPRRLSSGITCHSPYGALTLRGSDGKEHMT